MAAAVETGPLQELPTMSCKMTNTPCPEDVAGMRYDRCQTTLDAEPRSTKCQTPLGQNSNITTCRSPVVSSSRHNLRPAATQTPVMGMDAHLPGYQSPMAMDRNPTCRCASVVSDANQTARLSPTTLDVKPTQSPSRAYSVTPRADSRAYNSATYQDDGPCLTETSHSRLFAARPRAARNYPWDFTPNDIRLATIAKMRGQKDLLSMHSVESSPSRQRVFYPRNNWFYHLDNAMEDAASKTNVNCHNSEELGNKADAPPAGERSKLFPPGMRMGKGRRIPYRRNDWFYHLDNIAEDNVKRQLAYSAYSRPRQWSPGDGQATPPPPPQQLQSQGSFNQGESDLNHSLPAGVHNCPRTSDLSCVQNPPHGTPNADPKQQGDCNSVQQTASVYRMPGDNEVPSIPKPDPPAGLLAQVPPPNMSKLLANAYQDEWMESVKQRANARSSRFSKTDLISSEYKTAFGPALRASQRVGRKWANVQSRFRLPSQKGTVLGQPRVLGNSASGAEGGPGSKTGEKFILSRFKKIGPKIDAGARRTSSVKTVC